MGGVDLNDAKLYAYLAERRTMKWTPKYFYLAKNSNTNQLYIVQKKITIKIGLHDIRDSQSLVQTDWKDEIQIAEVKALSVHRHMILNRKISF